jgi:hypothetical protein
MTNEIVQTKLMWEDIKRNGYGKTGIYKGIEWKTNLLCRGRDHKDESKPVHWCGYVIYENGKLTEEEYEELNQYSHYEMTCYLGFDCGHYGDFSLLGDGGGIWRTHEYVETCIKKMIDFILTCPSHMTKP